MTLPGIRNEKKALVYRSTEKEYMDNPDFQGNDLTESFKFIKMVNLLGGGRMAVLNCLQKALKRIQTGRTISVLDVGCGIGDMGNAIVRWGKARGIFIRYIGLEKSEHILREARKHPHGENISFLQGDLFASNLPEVDIVIISMVLHHFDDHDVVAAIRHLAAKSRIALLINELERSLCSYLICQLLTMAMRNSSSRYDALLSIRKGFTTTEISRLIFEAGLSGSVRRGLGWRILSVIPGASL